VRRFWNRRAGGDEFEDELRASRPEPRAEFVQALARRLEPDTRRPKPGWARTALAGGVSALTLGALTLGGGLGYAASAVNSVVDEVDRATSKSGPTTLSKTPSDDQYRPGKGCGDKNHIHDRESQCKVEVKDASVKEGNSGTTSMVFTISLSDFALSAVTVVWSTADGTAGPGDYLPAAGVTVTIPEGASSATAPVSVVGDTVAEPNELFYVNLTSVSDNAYIVDGQGVGTIFNDDLR
jgi:fibronectin-binding autotransporter adhesin